MFGRVILALALCSVSAGLPPAPALTLRRITNLSGDLAEALDVRWSSADEVVLAAAKNGVFRHNLTTGKTERILGSAAPRGFFFSSRLGLSSSFVVPGSPFAALAWTRNAPGATLSPQFPFDMILDLDVYGDTLAVLGARRAADGRWAPEGGIAWIGSLEKGLKDLRPVHYSESGGGAKALDRCHFFNTGAIRFLRDGTLLVVPGVEPGMYLYEPGGKLLKTWDTQPLGFFDRCEFTEKQGHAMGAAPTATWQYLNARTVLDDVIPLPGGTIGLFTRRFTQGKMHFTLSVVNDGKVTQRIELPLSGGERSFVRADVRAKKIALLLVEYATAKTPDGARLAILELP
ncbi:MAG TPA: hypothetical protein VND45_12980 [Thermoanaerobaculia bacterium]|jgi:hypothetical protein|nr:hypothetical protein [Thermoanaerobaculia bacterium]